MNFCLNRVCWSNQVIPLLDSTISDEFHTDRHVSGQVLCRSSGVWRATEETASGCICEPAHLQFGNYETVLVDRVYYFSSVHVGVWLNQSELGFFATGEGLARCCVTIVCNLELSSVDSDDGTDVQLRNVDAGAVHSLEEHPSVFQIVLTATKAKETTGLETLD